MQRVARAGLEVEAFIKRLRLFVLGVSNERSNADLLGGSGHPHERVLQEGFAEPRPLDASVDRQASKND